MKKKKKNEIKPTIFCKSNGAIIYENVSSWSSKYEFLQCKREFWQLAKSIFEQFQAQKHKK